MHSTLMHFAVLNCTPQFDILYPGRSIRQWTSCSMPDGSTIQRGIIATTPTISLMQIIEIVSVSCEANTT